MALQTEWSVPSGIADLLNEKENYIFIETVALFTIGTYGGLEVILASIEFFKEYRGLYFWSMQIAAWGIVSFSLVTQVTYLRGPPELYLLILGLLAWCAMVTGQALVLYSRLHLVVNDTRYLRFVLYLIVTDAIILHVPTVCLYIAYQSGAKMVATPAFVFPVIEVIGCCLQDLFICGLYIHASIRALKPVLEVRGREGRKVIYNLIIVSIIVVILNVADVVALFLLPTSYNALKSVFYSIKLKLEFFVLTRLRELTRSRYDPCPCTGLPNQLNDISIFDVMERERGSRPCIQVPSTSAMNTLAPRARSLPQSTLDFHQALRETTSAEGIVSSSDPRGSTGTSDLEAQSRLRFGSVESTSTTERHLLEPSKTIPEC